MTAIATSRNQLPSLSFAAGPGCVPIDLDRLVGTRLLIQASSGGGKSYCLRWLLEQTHGRIQQFVLDWEGEFASLRERFAYVLAGQDGDVPADPRTAGLLCRRLLELSASAVLDLSELPPEDRQCFARGFLHELMHVPRSLWRPLLVAIDEAHHLAPEKGEGEAVSKPAVVALCTQGRKRGYAAVLATQRIAKVTNNALAELLNVLIGPTSFEPDVRRAGDALGFDKAQREQLKQLEPGQFFARGPALAREPVLVRTGPVQTTHPQPGRVAPPVPPPPEAIRALLGQLRDLPTQAPSDLDDLEQARGRIAELERALRERPIEVRTETVVERVEVPAIDAGTGQRLELLVATLRDTGAELVSVGDRLVAGLAQVRNGPAQVPRRAEPASRPRLGRAPGAHQARPHTTAPGPPAPSDGLSAPQQRILDALAAFEAVGLDQVAKSNIATWAGQSPTSSGFANNLGALRSRGLISYPVGGRVALTDAGRALAAAAEPVTSLEQLHTAWVARLSAPQGRLVRVLIDRHPEAMHRTELATAVGNSATSSGFANNLGALRSLGLIDYPQRGQVMATDLLFPELPGPAVRRHRLTPRRTS
jgi:uncharacterized protein